MNYRQTDLSCVSVLLTSLVVLKKSSSLKRTTTRSRFISVVLVLLKLSYLRMESLLQTVITSSALSLMTMQSFSSKMLKRVIKETTSLSSRMKVVLLKPNCTVYVTGLPGPPQGPLEVSGITKHTATLEWKPPKHDGGRKVTHYIVERKETTHSQWVTASSCCRDTTFTVQGLAEFGEYVFRVMAVNENGHGIPLDGLNPIIAKMPFDPPGPPGIPNVLEVGGDFVNLSWDKPLNDGGSRITGYWVDKREVGTEAWQQVNSNFPCPTNMYNISNLVEDRQYEFRVFAVNEAGAGPPSQATGSIKIKDPQGAVPPEFIQPLKTVMVKEGKTATFTCTVSGVPTPKITWFKGSRGNN